MKTATQKIIKHSGANWLKETLEYRNISISSFGIRVANILGQVYRGIYHVEKYVLREPYVWGQSRKISIKMGRELATYDGIELSFLALCCEAAGIEVSIRPSSYMYMAIEFSNSTPVPNSDGWGQGYETTIGSLKANDLFLSVKKIVNDKHKGMIQYSVGAIAFGHLTRLVSEAHEDCCRVSIRPRSVYSLELMASLREGREGGCWQRHPTLEQSRAILSPYTNIDYKSIQ